MLPAFVQSFLAYSVVEYLTVMGVVDNAIRIFLYRPEMSQDAKVRLMALEVLFISIFAAVLVTLTHHIPVVSILMIYSCVSSTKDIWQVFVWRYWNDFLEFEHFKPRQLFVPPVPSLPSPENMDKYLKNGGIDTDSRMGQTMPPTPLPMLNPRSTPTTAPPTFKAQWRKTLQSAMSSFRKEADRPPGLINKTQTNLCSMNVILQCLASTPLLAESLIREIPRIKTLPHLPDFVTELGGLLSDLRRSDQKTLSTEHLLEMITKLRAPQPHQDCVELLMWLLEAVNSAFLPPGPGEIEMGLQRYKLLRATPLAQPLLILYEPNQLPRALSRMRAKCLDTIEQSHALQSTSYADPIHRLTEVEWLAHKVSSHSIVDDMFSGQVVDAQHCTTCHHLSVSVQPFKVLPLPIASINLPKDRALTLQDCLDKFSAVEKLYGSNGLQCKYCNAQRGRHYSGEAKVQGLFRRSVLDSGVGGDSPLLNRGSQPDLPADFLSPIRPVRDDSSDRSVFVDSPGLHGKTSTPVQGGLWGGPSSPGPVLKPQATSSPVNNVPHLTDGERQALFSQLPDFFIIQLLRLTFRDGQPYKVNTPVSIPLSNLDLFHLATERHLGGDHKSSLSGCYKYNLYAMVLHLGENSVTRGHYLAYGQTDKGSWFCFDDDKVTPVNIEYEMQTRHLKENAYLLCYRKVKII